MPPKRQVRVGNQWMGARDAQRALDEALRVAREEEAAHGPHQSFISKYVFSVDHKWIGIQYAITALCFLFIGFTMMLLMRYQLAWPGTPFPGFIAKYLGESNAPGGVMLPEFYNQLGAMHGTVMVFLAIVPLAVGAFGNYLVPLMIGAPDMAFPKLNMMSYWLYLPGGLIMLSSFLIPGGAANSGWTSYPPLSIFATDGQTVWIVGMVFLITSSLLGSVNFIVTIIQLRAKGLTFMRLPFFVWAQLVTAFLLLLAFPPLEAAAILQLMDRVASTSFFLPSGLVVSGTPLVRAGGGNPLLWQHLFWFLAHPEVYVLILPGMGIISEIIANNTRKPLWGYKSLVGSGIFLGFMSFVVWAHHMFLTGMGVTISAFFQTTTMIISIPSVIILTALIISLWGAAIRFTVPMLFALAFLPMFGIGGLTGLPLGLAAADIHLHDTLYVIGHFHYVVAPGTIFAMFAGIYYWFPKVTGRQLNEFWGKVHFWLSLICMNCIFFPMFLQGLAGVSRRLYDGGAQYVHAKPVIHLNVFMSGAAFVLMIAQVPFILNFFYSIFKGRRVGSNVWDATTLEWAATTSPPLAHGNFAVAPVVYRGPYEYSVPGYDAADFIPQHIPDETLPAPGTGGGMLPATAVAQKES
ncbi:MAG: cbb3-type cytochrome c oxidase subunit I [Acidobacteriota bacterium]